MNIKERVDKAIEEVWAMSSEEFRAVFENADEGLPDEYLDEFTVRQTPHTLPEVYVHRNLSVNKANQFETSKTSRIAMSLDMLDSWQETASKLAEENSFAVESEVKAA